MCLIQSKFLVSFIDWVIKQESPPAWMQEAYRLPDIKYSICCPMLRWGGPHPWTGGILSLDLTGLPPSGPGWGITSIQTWLGYPLERDLGPVTGAPPRKDVAPVEVLWDRDRVTPRCGQIDAGGNYFSANQMEGMIGQWFNVSPCLNAWVCQNGCHKCTRNLYLLYSLTSKVIYWF